MLQIVSTKSHPSFVFLLLEPFEFLKSMLNKILNRRKKIPNNGTINWKNAFFTKNDIFKKIQNKESPNKSTEMFFIPESFHRNAIDLWNSLDIRHFSN